MAKVVVMPKLGLTMTEGTVSKWLKKVGDAVKAGQPLILFDREKIKAAGYPETVVVLLTNSDDLEGVDCGVKKIGSLQ